MMPNSTKWAVVAGFLVSLAVWIAKLYKIDVPPEIAAGGTAAITITIQHFVKDDPQ